MRKLASFLLILLMLCYACKKESGGDNTIELDKDGNHLVFTVTQTTIKVMGSYRQLAIIATNSSAGRVGLQFYDFKGADSCFTEAGYDLYCNDETYQPPCDTTQSAACRKFAINYTDNVNQYYQGRSAGVGITPGLHVTSCTGNPPVISGTFQSYITNWDSCIGCMPDFIFTNGKINQVKCQ